MRLALTAAAVAATVLLPSAAACHVGLGVFDSTGIVVAEGRPIVADLRLGDHCEGLVPVEVRLHTRQGIVVDAFEAELDIAPPSAPQPGGDAALAIRGGDGRQCLFQGCGDFAPSVLFTLRNVRLAVNLAGHLENVHLAVSWQLAGSFHGQGAVFVAGAA